MLNVLVTGSNGQLGSELRELVQRGTAEACTSEEDSDSSVIPNSSSPSFPTPIGNLVGTL